MRPMLVLCCLAFLPAVAFSGPGVKTEREPAIGIQRGWEQWLSIYADGSGVVGFGDGGGCNSCFFPKGTFDAPLVELELKALRIEKGKFHTHYSFYLASERKGARPASAMRFTRDRKLIDSLYRKAWKAGGKLWQGALMPPRDK